MIKKATQNTVGAIKWTGRNFKSVIKHIKDTSPISAENGVLTIYLRNNKTLTVNKGGYIKFTL